MSVTAAFIGDFFAPATDGASLLGLPTERAAKRRLPGQADEVLTSISSIMDEIVLGAIEKRTAKEFLAYFDERFSQYARLVVSFGRIVSVVVPKPAIARLAAESFCELESDIRAHGVASFGEAMRDRAAFTVWTLRQISEQVDALIEASPSGREHEKEAEFYSHFLFHALRARFNIDCLTASMRLERAIFADVLPVIDDGLCSAVDAYAWAKQALALRVPSDELQQLPDYWTTEDEEILSESMRELNEDQG